MHVEAQKTTSSSSNCTWRDNEDRCEKSCQAVDARAIRQPRSSDEPAGPLFSVECALEGEVKL